jgi:hypothetical protein
MDGDQEVDMVRATASGLVAPGPIFRANLERGVSMVIYEWSNVGGWLGLGEE